MKLKNLLLLFFLVLPFKLFSQNSYYITDSLTNMGVYIENNGSKLNAQFCCVGDKWEVIRYTPYEVKEYRFNGGPVYVAKDIQLKDSVKRVFLERVVEGKTALYYYRGKNTQLFFIEKDSTLFIQLPKEKKSTKSFRDYLLELTADCPEVADAAKLVDYNKADLKEFMNRYQACNPAPFPFIKYGLVAGYEIAKLQAVGDNSENLKLIDFNYKGSATIGAFIDYPLPVRNTSLYVEAYCSKHSYSYNKRTDHQDLFYLANISSLKVPVCIKYTFPSRKIRPFFNAGAIFAYNFDVDSKLLISSIVNQVIYTDMDRLESPIISKGQCGFTAGGGVEYKLNYRNSLFFQLCYSNLYGASSNNTLNTSSIQFSTGINF